MKGQERRRERRNVSAIKEIGECERNFLFPDSRQQPPHMHTRVRLHRRSGAERKEE